MRARFLWLFAFLFLATPAWPQYDDEPQKAPSEPATLPRYANMPDDAVPYRKFTKPYKEWFVEANTLEYNGAAREEMSADLYRSKSVNIGFLGPIDPNHPDVRYGVAMLNGATMAIDEANAAGGYGASGMSCGKPYDLKIHSDLPLWGASSTEIVKMKFDEHVVAMLGAIDGASTHIALRASLKLEIPIMDTGTTDPTVTETRIQWLLHNFPDDRQQGYALADYVFKQLKLKRIGVLRTQSRYARIGVAKFSDEARRMGHTPLLEVKFERGDTDFSTQLRMLQNAKIEGLVIWGEPPEAGLILKQMRALGMKQPAFGASRLVYPQLLEIAGSAAEGFVATSALDPSRKDPKWLAFVEKYRQRFNQEPDGYAAYAYDGMTMLIKAIEKAGLNRGLIMDALREYELKEYAGAAGRAQFDYTLNNIAPVTLARVEGGKFVYFPAHHRESAAALGGAGSQ
ncbi:MAG: ABC transporter substrate-binding protein [Candidatus Acidiferrales bacterium]|jgi:ABC-type branched-subunit amino acid transport system substrate-binding protein